MKQWWQNLSTRDQLILIITSALGFLFLFYAFIWAPLNSSIASNKTYVNYQQSLLSWMQQANVELKNLRASGIVKKRVNPSELLAVVDTSLQQVRLKNFATSIQQSGTNKVVVNFKQIPFDPLITWIQNSWETHSIKVNQLNITPNPNETGLVNAEVFLEAK